MTEFEFDKEKAINAVLYILDQTGENDFYKIFKILYFAEREHLKKYGTPVTGDKYISMDFGPVPSWIYDMFKGVRDENGNFEKYSLYFGVDEIYVTPKAAPNFDELSTSDIEALNKSIQDNAGLSFSALKRKSHDMAWEMSRNKVMSYVSIATSAGADEKMISYMRNHIENLSL